jgi:hypothetical protein
VGWIPHKWYARMYGTVFHHNCYSRFHFQLRNGIPVKKTKMHSTVWHHDEKCRCFHCALGMQSVAHCQCPSQYKLFFHLYDAANLSTFAKIFSNRWITALVPSHVQLSSIIYKSFSFRYELKRRVGDKEKS